LIHLIFTQPHHAFASGAVEQRQRAAGQREEALRKQQAQIIQQQQQAYQQALQQKAYNQAAQQQSRNIHQQRQAYQQAAQQAVQSSVQPSGVLQSGYNQAAQQAIEQQQVYQGAQNALYQTVQPMHYGDLFYEPPVEEVVDISQIWEKMELSSESWALMIDLEPKILTVQRVIDQYEAQGIHIRKSAVHYIEMIDSMAYQSPNMLKNPFVDIIKIIAIIEYDFDNGQNKDAMAKQVLGSGYEANKKRLGL